MVRRVLFATTQPSIAVMGAKAGVRTDDPSDRALNLLYARGQTLGREKTSTY
jgi:hypothetical protein